jgi:hypothetical protein
MNKLFMHRHISKILAPDDFGKIGLRLVSEYNDGIPCVWYELDKINYQNENNKIAGVPNISICLAFSHRKQGV